MWRRTFPVSHIVATIKAKLVFCLFRCTFVAAHSPECIHESPLWRNFGWNCNLGSNSGSFAVVQTAFARIYLSFFLLFLSCPLQRPRRHTYAWKWKWIWIGVSVLAIGLHRRWLTKFKNSLNERRFDINRSEMKSNGVHALRFLF